MMNKLLLLHILEKAFIFNGGGAGLQASLDVIPEIIPCNYIYAIILCNDSV
jgi:hypothetical protein